MNLCDELALLLLFRRMRRLKILHYGVEAACQFALGSLSRLRAFACHHVLPEAAVGGNMAELNQFSTHKKMEDSSVGFSSTHLPLIFAGLLTVALFLGVSSCSKKGGTQLTGVSSQSSAPVA